MQFSKPDVNRSIHGSLNLTELRTLGLDPGNVIDFSANINPLGTSIKVKKAMSEVEVDSYPDPDCHDLREALSQAVGVAIENTIVGNGSTELIHFLGRACLANNSGALILAPTFGEYEQACLLAGTIPRFIWSKEIGGFYWDISDVCNQLTDTKPHLVFLCNPNNPTGIYLNEGEVRLIAEAAAPGILVIDEAYIHFVENPWDSMALLDMSNVVVLRSMTKDHAIAGIRLGYALAPVQVIEVMKLYQPFWNVNMIAQVAGLAALADQEHVAHARRTIVEGKAYLYAALEELGINALPSSVNFLLLKVGDAKTIRFKLLQRNLCVRDCTSFGLPQYIRVTVRALPDCQKLVEGLKEVWGG